MTRRSLGSLITALWLAVTGCDESSQSNPSAPRPETPALEQSPPSACSFTGMNSLIAQYFTSASLQQEASDRVDDMEAAGAQSAVARDNGFSVMALIGTASRTGAASSASTGSTLTQELIKCMFDVTTSEFSGFPTDPRYEFSGPLTPATGGVYYVRGGAADSTSYPVVAHDASLGAGPVGNISGIAPPPSFVWRNTAVPPAPRNGILNERVLIHGEPVLGGYDWRVTRPNATFDPFAVVALCTGSSDPAAMVQQLGVGVLAYEGDGTAICGAAQSVAFFDGGQGAFGLMRRLVQSGMDLLAPQQLYAAALQSGPTGGAGGAKGDVFTQTSLGTVTLTFTPKPQSVQRVNQPFTVTVRATTPDGSSVTGVNGVCAFATGTNNNGTPTQILGIDECSGGQGPSAITKTVGSVSGVASLTVTVTKSGALVFAMNGFVIGRPAVQVIGTSIKMNFRPPQ